MIVKDSVSSVEKRLGVTISNTLLGCSHHLIKTCNSYLFLLSRIKVFLSRRNRILFYNSYILPYLDFCCIIWGNCSSTLEDKLVKFQKTAARVILDCDFYTPSSAILMFRIINKICPDYLKITIFQILLTYHVEILDLLTVINYIRQNLTANFPQVIHVLWCCHLEFSPPTC